MLQKQKFWLIKILLCSAEFTVASNIEIAKSCVKMYDVIHVHLYY